MVKFETFYLLFRINIKFSFNDKNKLWNSSKTIAQ